MFLVANFPILRRSLESLRLRLGQHLVEILLRDLQWVVTLIVQVFHLLFVRLVALLLRDVFLQTLQTRIVFGLFHLLIAVSLSISPL